MIGGTETGIHYVKEIEITEPEFYERTNGHGSFFTKKIRVKQENGTVITLTLYSDVAKNLEVETVDD